MPISGMLDQLTQHIIPGVSKKMSTILTLNFVAVKMFPLLLFWTNNLMLVLSVLVAWQGNDNSSFSEVEFSRNWISLTLILLGGGGGVGLPFPQTISDQPETFPLLIYAIDT